MDSEFFPLNALTALELDIFTTSENCQSHWKYKLHISEPENNLTWKNLIHTAGGSSPPCSNSSYIMIMTGGGTDRTSKFTGFSNSLTINNLL